MNNIIEFLKTNLGAKLIALTQLALQALSKFSTYLITRQEIKVEKTKKKVIEKEDKKIEDVCNKGSLSDLLNLGVLITILIFTGCKSEQVVVESTKSWEGHYYTEEQAQAALDGFKLDKKESVWILSNTTLERVLKNVKKGKQQ